MYDFTVLIYIENKSVHFIPKIYNLLQMCRTTYMYKQYNMQIIVYPVPLKHLRIISYDNFFPTSEMFVIIPSLKMENSNKLHCP